MRLLIVGGYGVFGGRIVELLESEARLTIVVAGRSAAKGAAFCTSRGAVKAKLETAAFDRDGDLSAQLKRLSPDVVIDASGPFQDYGAGAYRLVEAAIDAGVHYLDLADGSDFVAGVSAYDARAKAAGVYVLSGVSSFPVLTAAVVRVLAQDMTRVKEIVGGIAPSPFAGVGENVIRAIASYAGQPVARLGPNVKVIGRPFTQQRRYTIAPPGRTPLRNTLFSLVDVPDLRVLSELWPEAQRVWMGAGPAPEVLHRALIFCAWLVRFGLVRTLAPLAPLMHWAMNRLRWGEHRGGMFVEVKGVDAGGRARVRSWHLLAEGADGPFIPSMAAQAIVLKQLDGDAPAPGARACVRELELADYERLFAARIIYSGFRETQVADAPLYQRILGDAWSALSESVRAMHDGARLGEGVASVERGSNPFAWLAGVAMSFPPAHAETPVRVHFDVSSREEVWTRTFGAHRFRSAQYEGKGRWRRLLVERFGALEFAMALVRDGKRLRLVMRAWRAFGVPMPLWFAPRSDAYETEEGGVFRFFVEISHPLVGLIVRYRGWLKPA
ncbi:SDR family oxidoreductase [Vitreimonas flagellata]|uniref:SDR family oxidoreductase n=1 Tax=Vitreimonas flagellata TaxID=2560861 RepID=UPI0010756A98|nr:SDR family oxidoreductase [Vitreimonas flagellata]